MAPRKSSRLQKRKGKKIDLPEMTEEHLEVADFSEQFHSLQGASEAVGNSPQDVIPCLNDNRESIAVTLCHEPIMISSTPVTERNRAKDVMPHSEKRKSCIVTLSQEGSPFKRLNKCKNTCNVIKLSQNDVQHDCSQGLPDLPAQATEDPNNNDIQGGKKERCVHYVFSEEQKTDIYNWYVESVCLWDKQDQRYHKTSQKGKVQLHEEKAKEIGCTGRQLMNFLKTKRKLYTELTKTRSGDGLIDESAFTDEEKEVMEVFHRRCTNLKDYIVRRARGSKSYQNKKNQYDDNAIRPKGKGEQSKLRMGEDGMMRYGRQSSIRSSHVSRQVDFNTNSTPPPLEHSDQVMSSQVRRMPMSTELRRAAEQLAGVTDHIDIESNQSSRLSDIPEDFVPDMRAERKQCREDNDTMVDRLMSNFFKAIEENDKQQCKREEVLIQTMKEMQRNTFRQVFGDSQISLTPPELNVPLHVQKFFESYIASSVAFVTQDKWPLFQVELQQVLNKYILSKVAPNVQPNTSAQRNVPFTAQNVDVDSVIVLGPANRGIQRPNVKCSPRKYVHNDSNEVLKHAKSVVNESKFANDNVTFVDVETNQVLPVADDYSDAQKYPFKYIKDETFSGPLNLEMAKQLLGVSLRDLKNCNVHERIKLTKTNDKNELVQAGYIVKLRHLSDDELGIDSLDSQDAQYPYTMSIESSAMSEINIATEVTDACDAAISTFQKQLSEPQSFNPSESLYSEPYQ